MSIVHANNGRSAELSFDSLTMVPQSASIRCRRDYLVIEPLDFTHSAILIVPQTGRPLRGVVKAVGPGHYPWRYNHPEKGKRTLRWESKTFQPAQCKVGDVVDFGDYALGHLKYPSFLWGDRLHLLLREADLTGVEPAQGDAPDQEAA